jgi:hypothetical protein
MTSLPKRVLIDDVAGAEQLVDRPHVLDGEPEAVGVAMYVGDYADAHWRSVADGARLIPPSPSSTEKELSRRAVCRTTTSPPPPPQHCGEGSLSHPALQPEAGAVREWLLRLDVVWVCG